MSVATPRLAVIRSRFNEDITLGLECGVVEALGENGIELSSKDIFAAPGAFELPLMAARLARTGRYDGIICLGCVIKGDTAHFEFISLGATIGLMQAQLELDIPISFGILTTYDEAQAEARSAPGPENKGREAALACLEAIRFGWSLK